MKKFSIFACLSVFLTVAAFSQMQTRPETPAKPAPAGAPRAMANNDATYVALRTIQLGTENVHVNNFTLTRDAGTFVFKSGVFRLLQPVNGKITGAVFTGDASFALKPPIAVEQRYLGILTKGQPFQEEFGSAVFRFTDGTEQEIRKAAANDSSPASGDASGLLDDVRQQLKKKLKTNMDARLLEDVLSSRNGGLFVAFIKGRKYSEKMIYEIDPEGVTKPDAMKPEEVELTTWDDNHYGVWASFHFSNEYKAGTANSDEQNYPFAVEHQKLDTTIERNAHLNATAETKIVALQDGVRVLGLDLYPTLRVESVTAEGQQLSFIQEDKDQDADFAVILPRELKKGESYTLVTKYGGKDAVSNEGGGNYYPIARENWYPGLGFGSYANYDMTFHVPKGMKMAATGKKLKDIDEGGENITEWTSEVPQAVAGFNFGKFKREEGKPFKQPYLLETYANPEPPDMIKSIQMAAEDVLPSAGSHMPVAALGTMSTLSLMKKAMAEGQIAVDLYTDYFGEAPYKRLAMTQQTAPNFGQSWPGLVYLPITYFFDSTVRHQLGIGEARGYFKVVGPHEIAHQWFGHMVGFNSYRDQWMSEGFADMSASIFLQVVYSKGGLDEYHKFWAEERQLMTEANKEGKRPIDVGPVTLGYRLLNAKTGFDIYRRLIYPKGAYILQMIRFMLQDTRSPDPDARFKAMMHEFTKTYANRIASTEDFKAVLEKYMTPDMDLFGNHKMDWFFNQYVYGTDYPTYRLEHSFSNDANGDWVLNMKITQSDVGPNFAMAIPVYLELSNGKVVRLGNAKLLGSNSMEQHFPLKGLKEKPKRAMLAYFDDVLGNVENK
ncbi:MAG TPA: M1 family aminopeptidase [Candidatus Angelobacter sp.]|nr:M1 family aminopeptidase [Candidatus Angelobacter sp.]